MIGRSDDGAEKYRDSLFYNPAGLRAEYSTDQVSWSHLEHVTTSGDLEIKSVIGISFAPERITQAAFQYGDESNISHEAKRSNNPDLIEF